MDSRSNDPPYSIFSILLSRSRSWILMFTSVVCSGTLDLCSFIYVNRQSPTPMRNNAVVHNYVEAGKMQSFFLILNRGFMFVNTMLWNVKVNRCPLAYKEIYWVLACGRTVFASLCMHLERRLLSRHQYSDALFRSIQREIQAEAFLRLPALHDQHIASNCISGEQRWYNIFSLVERDFISRNYKSIIIVCCLRVPF